jgi:hypothetical protein
MARDLTPGRIGLRTAIKLGIPSTIAMMLMNTIARKEDACNFSSMTKKTIPAEARPRVRSKTHRKTVACFREMLPQQQDVATVQHLRNLGSGVSRELLKFLSSSGCAPGPWSIGVKPCV